MSHRNREDWDEIWDGSDIPEWDYLSQVILDILRHETSGIGAKLVLEAGSGTGRISLKLAKMGAQVALLDNSQNAVDFSRRLFSKEGISADIIKADIHKMPYPDGAFDVVWNAGVIEHFTGREQADVLFEMARVCKKGGRIITINPYAKCGVHALGVSIMKRLGIYPFGKEVPITTIKEMEKVIGCRLKQPEYSTGFMVLWVGLFKRLTLFPAGFIFKVPLWLLNKFFCALDGSFAGEALRKLDLWLAKIFGGYLLVSVLEK